MALQTCFSGKQNFRPATGLPTYPPLEGQYLNGSLDLTGSMLLLRLAIPLIDNGPIDLVVKQVKITSKITTSKLKGQIAGVVDLEQAFCSLLPLVSKQVNSAVSAGNEDSDRWLANDNDGDGELSVEELRCVPLIKTLFSGDVDTDGDGEKELSIAVAFEAVGAVISP
jgi:hypothetical protein